MGSYTAIGAPVKIIIPGPRQKSPVELPKIKLHLNKQQNAMVRLPCSTGSVSNIQSRGSQQQAQKLQHLQQMQQLQQVNLAQPLCQQPQVQPVHLANQLTHSQVTQENQELQEPQYTTEQHEQPEKTVTFADVHTDQYGRCSPIHGSSDSGRSTPTQTSSGRSSPAQSIQCDQSSALMARRPSITPTQTSSGRSSPAQSIQCDQSSALMARRPSITQLVVYQPQQQIVPKPQAHKIRHPTNKRKASLTNIHPASMQLALPIVVSNQQQMMVIPKKQIEYQQCHVPKGYKSARKTSNSSQELVIKIVVIK